MKIKNLLQLFVILFSISIQAQKLPDNALDENVAFIFYPTGSVDRNSETFESFSNSIQENGYNLVGKYVHTNSPVSLKEIQYDINHKDVKYIFLLTYKHAKEANYDLYFFENDPEMNPELLDPKKTILSLKPGFVHTTKDFRGTIRKLLIKQTEKLKESNQEINQASFDKELINHLLLSEEEVVELNKLNQKNTIIDGATLAIENTGIPKDLKNGNLAVIGVSKENYSGYKLLNKIIKSKIKKYPFKYEYFKNYEDYLEKGGDSNFEYKLQLTRNSVSAIGTSTLKYTTASLYRDQESNKTSFYSNPSIYQKDLFSIVILNNETSERNSVSDQGFIGRTIKEFIEEL